MNNKFYTMTTTAELQGPTYNSWQPTGIVNKKLQAENSIDSNWKYRQYIQNNANHIMKYNTKQAIYESGNNPYTISSTNGTETSPFLYKSIHDNRMPEYGFRNTDLKQNYMNKEQIKAKMISPFIEINN